MVESSTVGFSECIGFHSIAPSCGSGIVRLVHLIVYIAVISLIFEVVSDCFGIDGLTVRLSYITSADMEIVLASVVLPASVRHGVYVRLHSSPDFDNYMVEIATSVIWHSCKLFECILLRLAYGSVEFL